MNLQRLNPHEFHGVVGVSVPWSSRSGMTWIVNTTTSSLKFTVVKPIRRVNLDPTQGMLRKLDQRAARLNVSRQAAIKTLLGRALTEAPLGKPGPKRRV